MGKNGNEKNTKLNADFYVGLGSVIAGIYSFVVFCFFMISYFIDKPFCFPASWNDMGDTISGILAPLVLLFFIISVLIQRSEFQLSRDEMASSRGELENQAAQMQLSGMAPILEKKMERDLVFIKDFLDKDYHSAMKYLNIRDEGLVMDAMLVSLEERLRRISDQYFYDPPHKIDKMDDAYSAFRRELLALYGGVDSVLSKKNDIKFYKNTFEKLLKLYIKAGVLDSKEFNYEEAAQIIDTKYCMAYERCLSIFDNIEDVILLSNLVSNIIERGENLILHYKKKIL